MLDPSDARAALASYGAGNVKRVTAYSPAEFAEFYANEPQETSEHARTWWFRGQNMIVGYSQTSAGARLERKQQPDEYMWMLFDRSSSADVTTPSGTTAVDGFSLTIVPPGASEVVIKEGGRVLRLFSTEATDLDELCSNKDSYRTPHPNVAPLVPWPDPIGGYKVRTYTLDVPKRKGRHGTMYRCTNLMINYVDVYAGPRDTTKLSPHSHDDFEQCSFLLEGEVVHHVRFPWTSNLAMWIDDVHVRIGSPSVAILPPPSIHTTMSIGPGANQLIDIFSPPRVDWSEQAGWVLNGDEYPMPEGAGSPEQSR